MTMLMTKTTKRSGEAQAPEWPTPEQQPIEYPSELEQEVVSGGLRYIIRPIVPADADALAAFHSHLSPYSQYLRFFGCHPSLSPNEVQHFTNVDYSRRLALVAVLDGQIIGVGRFDREPAGDEAEVAFVVADDFHHHGVATLLLDHLVAAARSRCITAFVAHAMWENHDMLSVFSNSGFDILRGIDCGIVTLRFPIRTTATSCWLLGMRDSTRQVTPHPHGAGEVRR